MAHPTFPEIYLDANATTPVWPDAAQAAFAAMEDLYGNPSSSHITGLRARSILESARSLAKAALAGSPASTISRSATMPDRPHPPMQCTNTRPPPRNAVSAAVDSVGHLACCALSGTP